MRCQPYILTLLETSRAAVFIFSLFACTMLYPSYILPLLGPLDPLMCIFSLFASTMLCPPYILPLLEISRAAVVYIVWFLVQWGVLHTSCRCWRPPGPPTWEPTSPGHARKCSKNIYTLVKPNGFHRFICVGTDVTRKNQFSSRRCNIQYTNPQSETGFLRNV